MGHIDETCSCHGGECLRDEPICEPGECYMCGERSDECYDEGAGNLVCASCLEKMGELDAADRTYRNSERGHHG